MHETSPCMDCTEKFIACHGNCPKDNRGEFGYKAWLDQYHAQKKYAKESHYGVGVLTTAAREKTHREYLKFTKYGRHRA